MEFAIKDKTPPLYDTIQTGDTNPHAFAHDSMINWPARRGDGGLLLLTVRVGGESIDGILLELAVLLAHLCSLVLCVDSNARDLHRSFVVESLTLPHVGELSLIKESHRPTRISRSRLMNQSSSLWVLVIVRAKIDTSLPEEAKNSHEEVSRNVTRSLLLNAGSLAPLVLKSRRCSIRFHPIRFLFVIFSPVKPLFLCFEKSSAMDSI